MLIPETLFDCIKNSHGLECLAPLNVMSIGVRRYQRSRTPEQKKEFKKLMSKVMKKVRKDYCANCSPSQKKAFAKRMSKGQKRYWDNITPEQREKHIKSISKGVKKAWANGDMNIGTKEEIVTRIHKAKFEKDIPRINTYRGVITMSEIESL